MAMARETSGPDFSEEANLYDRTVGERSRKCCRLFLDWLSLPQGLRWIDVGCGTGALTETVQELCDPAEIIGVDPSEAQIEEAKLKPADDRKSYQVADALSLPFDNDRFDVASASFVLNFVGDQQKMINEMSRVVCPGGTVSVLVWDHSGEQDPFRFHMRAIKEKNPTFYEGEYKKRGWGFTDPQVISDLFDQAGLSEVQTKTLEFEESFDSFDDYWMSLTARRGSTTHQFLETLTPEAQAAFREEICAGVPTGPGIGEIRFPAGAQAVRGQVPAS